jgi:hypothetical protein
MAHGTGRFKPKLSSVFDLAEVFYQSGEDICNHATEVELLKYSRKPIHKSSPIIFIQSLIPRIEPISLRSILMLFSHFRLGLAQGILGLPVDLPVKILKALLLSSILATWPSTFYSSKLNHPDYIRWPVKYVNFLKMEPSPLLILIALGPNIRLRILYLNTLSPHSSLNVRDHVLQPYSPTGNINSGYRN